MEFPTVSLIDQLLATCRKFLSVKLIDLADNIGEMVGGWTVYGIAVLLFIAGIIAGIRIDSVEIVISGILILPVGVILHYVAIKMVGAEDRLVKSTPTRMHTEGILYVIAVAAGVIGIIGLPVSIVFGIIEAIDGNYEALATIVFAAYLVYLAALALNPRRIAVNDSGETTIGQEAIGLATFLLKSVYKFVSVLFGMSAVVVAILSLITLVQSIAEPAGVGAFAFIQAVQAFILLCLAPLLAYGLFLLYYVIIDVIRALLTLGGSATAPEGGATGGGKGSGGASKSSSSSSKRSSGGGRKRSRSSGSSSGGTSSGGGGSRGGGSGGGGSSAASAPTQRRE